MQCVSLTKTVEPLLELKSGDNGEPAAGGGAHQHQRTLRQVGRDPQGVLHPAGEGDPLHVAPGLAGALVVVHHAGVVVHITISAHRVLISK
jgi:hypothetical protein